MSRPSSEPEKVKVGKKCCLVWRVFDGTKPSKPLVGLWVEDISQLWRGHEFLGVLDLFLRQYYPPNLFRVSFPPESVKWKRFTGEKSLADGLYPIERAVE